MSMLLIFSQKNLNIFVLQLFEFFIFVDSYQEQYITIVKLELV